MHAYDYRHEVCLGGRCIPSTTVQAPLDSSPIVMSSKQVSRRWYDENPSSSPDEYPPPQRALEDWLDQALSYLSEVHTLAGLDEISFSARDSSYSVIPSQLSSRRIGCNVCITQDVTIKLRGESFKWKWETTYLGPKLSAEILSKHLVVPLISAVHFAFTSPVVIGGMSGEDLEKVSSFNSEVELLTYNAGS